MNCNYENTKLKINHVSEIKIFYDAENYKYNYLLHSQGSESVEELGEAGTFGACNGEL